jgi:competence protein ComEC
MQRPLFWAALALIAGLVASVYWDGASWRPLVAGIAAALLALVPTRLAGASLLAGVFLLGLGLPSTLPEPPEFQGRMRVEGCVSSSPSSTLAILSLEATAPEMKAWEARRGRIELFFPEGAPRPGTCIVASGLARPLDRDDVLPGEPDPGFEARLDRMSSLVRVETWTRLGADVTARKGFEGAKNGALLRALAWGDKSGVSEETLDLFRATGTSHLLSISGLHIGLVAGGVGWLAGWLLRPLALWRPRSHASVGAALALAAIAVVYGQLAGWPVSAGRAVVMAVLGAFTLAFERGRDSWNLLGGAALILAFWEPGAMATPAWQLSFGAIAGLVLVTPVLSRFVPPDLPRPVAWVSAAMLTTAGATAGTLPAQALYFQSLPLCSVPANLVGVPLIGALATPAALLSIALPGIAGRVAIWVGDVAISLALGWFELIRGPVLWPAVGTVGAAALVVAVALLPRRPGASLLIGLLALGLREVPVDRLAVTFLSVGQGDAALVEWPDGRRWLVDGGPGRDDVARWLRRAGQTHLDAVVLSHPHPDHLTGLPAVVGTLRVDRLYVPRLPLPDESTFLELLRLAGTRAVPVVAVDSSNPGDLPFVLPPGGWHADPGKNPNDESLVLKFRFGKRSFLLPGDVEALAEAHLAPVLAPVDVLKVPHHGSRTSSTAPFLQAVAPRVAVVSVGAQNRFDHPCPEVLARYAGASVLRTDRLGTIQISTDGDDLHIRSWKVGRGWREENPKPQLRSVPPPAFSTALSSVGASSSSSGLFLSFRKM